MAILQLPAQKDTQKSIFDDNIKPIADFLLQHYEIRVSVQDPSKKYIRCKDADRQNIEPNEREISLHLASDGIRVGDATLRKILSSPYYIPHVDPIKEYFDSVRGTWNGTSQIDILCSHIKIREFGETVDKPYTLRAHKLIKKWLVACVGTWLDNVPNDVILGFIQSKGGSGKSFMMKYFLPPCLQDYYIESSKDEKKFDMEDVYTRYMIVNYDELEGITKGTINTLKKVQTTDKITIKRRDEIYATKKNRIGCGVLSTNFNSENGGFIYGWYGPDTRRFGLIEIDDIDKSYSQIIDINQIWAEALVLYSDANFDYHFDNPDYADFLEYNLRYRIETMAMKRLIKYVRPPRFDEETQKMEVGEKMTPTQILNRLVEMRHIKNDDDINSQKIGTALHDLGYEVISFRSKEDNNESRKGYHVVFIK